LGVNRSGTQISSACNAPVPFYAKTELADETGTIN
jgi:hypothetical protein